MIVIIIALLTGCTGKHYEKIQGIGEGQDSSQNVEREKQEGQLDSEIWKEEANGQKAKQEIIISDNETAAGDDKRRLLEGDLGKETGQRADGASPETGAYMEEKSLTLLFSGDVLLSNHVLNAYDKAGGIQGVLDEAYQKQIHEADFFLVNQEFPFSDRGTAAEDKQYTFRLSPDRVSLFQEMEIDGVTLANNHALDFGREALLDSCEILDKAGILHTGAGPDLDSARQPVSVELKGKRIALIGATRVIPVADWAAGKDHPGMLAAYDMTVLLEEIRRQKEENDFVAVCIHWGIERDEKPQEYQKTMGQQMIDAGADLVIGSHPHVLQGIEYYKGKPIVYSLGNFVFGSSIPRTALLQVSWENPQGTKPDKTRGEGQEKEGKEGEEETEEPILRLIPGTSASGYTRMLTDKEEREAFFRYMESISYGVSFREDGTVAAGKRDTREEQEHNGKE